MLAILWPASTSGRLQHQTPFFCRGYTQQITATRFRVRIRLADGTRKSTTITAADRDEADRICDAMIYELSEAHDVGIPTLAAFGDRFFDERELAQTVSANTLANDRRNWRNHVLDPAMQWNNVSITAISRSDVTAWLKHLESKRTQKPAAWKSKVEYTQKALSRQTRVHCRNVLKTFFDWAISKGFCKDNPAVGLEVRTAKNEIATDESWTYLSPDEIAMVDQCEKIPAVNHDLFLFAIYSGMRQGELWALKWKNVFLDEMPRVEVRRSHDRSTKSKKVRHFPLLPLALAALQRQRARVKHGPEDLVWPDAHGEQREEKHDAGWADRVRNKGEVRKGWKTVAGITRRVRFHDLRHTCASHLLMGTWGRAWSLNELSAYLGHSAIAVTQRYAHPSADHLHDAASMTFGPKNEQSGTNLVPWSQERAVWDQLGPMVPRREGQNPFLHPYKKREWC